MPIYYELTCRDCGHAQGCDQTTLGFYLNRNCPDCGGVMRITDKQIEKTGD